MRNTRSHGVHQYELYGGSGIRPIEDEQARYGDREWRRFQVAKIATATETRGPLARNWARRASGSTRGYARHFVALDRGVYTGLTNAGVGCSSAESSLRMAELEVASLSFSEFSGSSRAAPDYSDGRLGCRCGQCKMGPVKTPRRKEKNYANNTMYKQWSMARDSLSNSSTAETFRPPPAAHHYLSLNFPVTPRVTDGSSFDFLLVQVLCELRQLLGRPPRPPAGRSRSCATLHGDVTSEETLPHRLEHTIYHIGTTRPVQLVRRRPHLHGPQHFGEVPRARGNGDAVSAKVRGVFPEARGWVDGDDDGYLAVSLCRGGGRVPADADRCREVILVGLVRFEVHEEELRVVARIQIQICAASSSSSGSASSR
ncbi:hypothetical protein BV22DRAFT_1050728 [Leucogyrophana mollusca]|uniref:Uncharacterized protein n=1 Tax=Leucogyrophana mollusca TaxID=85980 RepID=A0ACB8B267_9AGAM|nr:hypothetical protein BV22DRAFT_1050728 [Leucogyrophana mollusca]